MHINKNVTVVLLLICLTHLTLAQSNDTTNVLNNKIKWSFDKTINVSNGDELSLGGYITTSSNTIIWVQNGADGSGEELSITEKTSDWPSFSSVGSVTYQVMLYNIPGTIVVRRDNANELSIRLTFTGESFEDMVYEYPVTNFEILNQ